MNEYTIEFEPFAPHVNRGYGVRALWPGNWAVLKNGVKKTVWGSRLDAKIAVLAYETRDLGERLGYE